MSIGPVQTGNLVNNDGDTGRTKKSAHKSKWQLRVRPEYAHGFTRNGFFSDPRIIDAALAATVPTYMYFCIYKYFEFHKTTSDTQAQLYHELIQKGYCDEAEQISQKNPGLLDGAYEGKKFVFWCIDTDSSERIELLKRKKVSFDITDDSNLSPLQYALKKRKFFAFKAALTAHNVSLSVLYPETKETLLHTVVRKNYRNVCEPLLNAIGDDPSLINRVNHSGLTAIHIALQLRRRLLFQNLVLKKTVNLTVRDKEEKTLFHLALESSRDIYFSQLMDQLGTRSNMDSSILDQKDKTGRTVAFVAVDKTKSRSTIQALMQAGIDLEAVHPKTGETLLHRFAKNGDSSLSAVFIAEAVEQKILSQLIDKTDRNGRTALYEAASRNYHDIVEQLLEKGANFSTLVDGREILVVAKRFLPCQKQSQRLVEKALHGRLVNSKSSPAETGSYTKEQAFFRCVRDGKFDQARRLVGQSSLNTVDEDGNGPLLLVMKSRFSESEKLELISFIRSEGGDVNHKNAAEESLLILAVEGQYHSIMKELLTSKTSGSKNINLNLTDKLGNSALHIAVLKDDFIAVEMLVKAGAKVNLQNNNGRTPLYFNISVRIAEYLLRIGGADTSVEDNTKLKPRDFAAALPKKDAVLRTLESYSPELSIQERAQWNENLRGAEAERAHATKGDIQFEDIRRLHEEKSDSLSAFGKKVKSHAASEAEDLAIAGVSGIAHTVESIGSAVKTTVEDTVVGTLATVNIGGKAASAGSQIAGAILDKGKEVALRKINGTS